MAEMIIKIMVFVMNSSNGFGYLNSQHIKAVNWIQK
jgi:hypothetical protein